MNKTSKLQYSQSTGILTLIEDDTETVLGTGWAGKGEGKNQPDQQEKKGIGPLPRGKYFISAPFTHDTCGPFCLRLTPYLSTKMYGRDGFLIHGASKNPAKYGQESQGCIIAARPIREAISSANRTYNPFFLEVVQ